MSTDAHSDKREIANDIEHLVTREFVGKSQRFFAQYRISSNHNRVLETSAFDQVLLHQRGDIFVVNKRACRRDLTLKHGRCYFCGVELSEAVVGAGLSAGNSKFVVR